MYPLKIEIPHDFLHEETRNNFIVSQTRKKIWAIELDLTIELFRVCDKYGLKAYAAFGTLLGAVRHNGFIPWDDDMDFFMFRDDYDKLMKVSSYEFEEPYFMQNALSDRLFFNGYARFRKSDTTGAVSFTDSPDFNNGIFIDIFVLDDTPSDPVKAKKQKRKTRMFSHFLNSYHSKSKFRISWKQRLVYPLIKPVLNLLTSYEKLFEKFENNIKQYNGSSSKVAPLCALGFKSYPKDCFKDIVYVPYEFITIPIPSGADELLAILYGNYFKLPPEEDRGTWHNDIITFNPDISYKEYYANIENRINSQL